MSTQAHSQPRTRRGVAAITVAALAFTTAACSVLLDRTVDQCKTDGDCASFGGHPYCRSGVCVASNLGPEGCFYGAPSSPVEFANQCSTAQCQPFDNCARLGLCGPDAAPPVPVAPPVPDAGPAPVDAGPPPEGGTPDAAPPPPALPPCVDPARNTVVIGGSTAVQPFLAVVAPLLAKNSPPYTIAYQPSGSCSGVDNLFSPDPAKHIAKDIAGKQALLFAADGTTTACTLGDGVPVDVAASDVFASSCTSTYATSDTLAEYLGPIQPMTFVVPSTSPETSISAEMAHVVFGLGTTGGGVQPYVDPTLFFIRNSGSGTQQMISRAIEIDAKKWWGGDRGGSGKVRDLLEAVPQTKSGSSIGILSTDFADTERARLRILAFKAKGQSCGYLPDSTPFTRDKLNVRDGHYAIWGPVHFYAQVSGGVPSAAAAALVTRFSLPRLDAPLLDAITKSGLVPACAMKVQRTSEMGPLTPFSPNFQCGCYFEANVPNGAAPPSCVPCNGPSDCAAATPACNNGFCEAK